MTIQTLASRFGIGLLLALLMLATSLAQEPNEEKQFFNGNDLTGWQGEMEFWSVKDGIITGHSENKIPNNKFLWSNVEVGDFYLSLDVLMPKDDRNAGIQFRSRQTPTENLQAVGYQADAGKNVWGRLYHEHGRGKLDWTDRGEKAVKPNQWNRYEILAVGNRIWTAINGQLSVAVHDPAGELRGHIALQIHSGQAQTVHYKINKLVHNPKVALADMTEAQLIENSKFVFGGKSNFIVIFTDDQGYGDLSCFGSTTIKTPSLDKMAKQGRKFTSFMVPTALCTPSRAALLTGCYPKRNGMHKWVLLPKSKEGLNPEEYTIADHLKKQGYATACIGKWHLGHHKETLPTNNGFDSYFGIPYSNDMDHPDNQDKPNLSLEGLDELWKNQESTLTKWKTPLMQNEKIIEAPVDQRTITRRYTDKSIEFIEENKDKPFFLYLAQTMPHLPLYVPDEFHDPDPKKAYIRTMEHIDAEVGRLLDAVREMGLDKNTYVIFTSDNGPASGNQHHAGSAGPLRGKKATTFEGGCRVPCVVRGPGIPAGTECDQLVSTLDILPTIAGMTGSKLPKDRKIDGLNASALLVDKAAKSPRDEMLYYDGHGNLEGIRKGKWKLLIKKRKENPTNVMLFDLHQDVGEKSNLAQANQDVVDELSTRMKTLGNEVDRNARQPWKKGGKKSKALIFDGTGWYRHPETKEISKWLVGLAAELDMQIDVTDDPKAMSNLDQYDVLILNNSNKLVKLFDENQRNSVRDWYRKGNGIVGLHAALVRQTEWEWLTKLGGCDFNSDSAYLEARIVVDPAAKNHPTVSGHGDEFKYTADWTNHDKSVTGLPGFKVLLRVDESSYEPVRDYFKTRGGKPMGKDHPIAWLHENQGGRFFYTELGHDVKSLNTKFGRQHIVEAIKWAARHHQQIESR